METIRELHAELTELRNELGEQKLQCDPSLAELSDIATTERVSKYTKTIGNLKAEKVNIPPPHFLCFYSPSTRKDLFLVLVK